LIAPLIAFLIRYEPYEPFSAVSPVSVGWDEEATMAYKAVEPSGRAVDGGGDASGGGGTGGGGGAPQQSSDEIARRSVATGQFNIKMNDKLTVSPTFIYQTMAGAHDEIIVQGLGSYLFNEEKDVTLLFGLGYRFRDAVHPIFGAQVKSLRVGLAYDVNISGLSADTNLRGGFELAASYIIRIYKPAVVKTKVLCPRF